MERYSTSAIGILLVEYADLMCLNDTVEANEFGVIRSWSSTCGLPIFPNALRAMPRPQGSTVQCLLVVIVAVRTQPFGWFLVLYCTT